ncbi:hypothetical protein CASFOL_018303 [Castilleja foliolosa]|uniref:Uncharacterized protein n=1 Tax=Castilleja foliolosa TaxID=1961234 RepID=A0ABD3DAC9_9LAMI
MVGDDRSNVDENANEIKPVSVSRLRAIRKLLSSPDMG